MPTIFRTCLVVALALSSILPVAQARLWTNTEGKSFEGDLVEVESNIAVIRRRDDFWTFRVPVKELSEEDREYIARYAKEQSENAANSALYSDSVYLDDLKEHDVKALVEIGKHGKKGTEDESFTFDKKIPKHSLFTHPGRNRKAAVTYLLNGDYDQFTGIAGITDTVRPHSAMTFRVLDGEKRILWESSPITRANRSQKFEIKVRNLEKIVLEVISHGSIGEAHAVWIDPKLTK